MDNQMKNLLFLLFSCTALLSCGGGSSPSTNQTSPISNAPVTWESGVYPDASDFKSSCETVRTQVDINGDAYDDVQGTEFDEKMWLRSWSYETYLWYSEIDDQDPDNYGSPQAYFDVLKTEQQTASGANKDNFHFYQSTEDYENFSQSGTSTGFGINWAFLATSPPRELRVSYTEPDSSAELAGVSRGDELLSIDGVDFINSNDVDFLNEVLFSAPENTSYEMVFRKNDGTEVSYTLTSGVYESSFVNNVTTFDTSAGRVGYMRFDGFLLTGQTPLIEGFEYFVNENITDLVLDLRYNGGGLLAMSSQLAYMIAGPNQTNGHNFETLQFNDHQPNTNPVTGATVSPTPFYSYEIDWDNGVLTNNELPYVSVSRVFIISTEDTCSASEALMNGLRGIDVEVVQIGSTTCGKPYGFYATDNCGTTYFTIQFQGVNDKGFGDYSEGFKPRTSPQYDDELPGCAVEDDFNSPLGDRDEGMLATALNRLVDGECPTLSGESIESLNAINSLGKGEQNEALSVFDARFRSFLRENALIEPIKEQP